MDYGMESRQEEGRSNLGTKQDRQCT